MECLRFGCEKQLDNEEEKFCGEACEKRYQRNLDFFIQTYEMTPDQMSQYLQQNQISVAEISRRRGVAPVSVWGTFKKVGIRVYRPEAIPHVTHKCENCQKPFTRPRWDHDARYCKKSCQAEATRTLHISDLDFRSSDLFFIAPKEELGSYGHLNLRTRHMTQLLRKRVDHYFFMNGICNENTAYVYGVMATDGNIRCQPEKGYASMRLRLTDLDIIEKIAGLIQYKNKIMYVVPNNPKHNPHYTIDATSQCLVNDLGALGCMPGKTGRIYYPLVRPELERHLIRGIIDGDGSWITSENKRKSLKLELSIVGNDQFLWGVYKRIFEHLGIKPQSIHYAIEYDKKSKLPNIAYITYNKTDAMRIREWVYEGATIYGQRKRDIAYSARYQKEEISSTILKHYLDVSKEYIHRGINVFKLPHKRSGNRFVFNESDVEAWVQHLKKELSSSDPKSGPKLKNLNALKKRWLDEDEQFNVYRLWNMSDSKELL
ncbi:hypothetical protein GC097_05530 [Paenibacillus sp. LMG 31457]|uniref:DOD-type homing endonuclease domain-containing protein n=1 Tax=Paenibacillus planticolens TaxID=2654976 RepID=A0ABX1ZIJ9_9BACL|nr:hypothetical protein [Paenibacillus planticolens]